MSVLCLKVDVDTLRGTLEGVPRLMDLFQRHRTGATFLFSLGPDHTGRAIKRIFRPGFFSKVRRTSVLKHYGLNTLLYGTLLPGPDIGRRAAPILRSVRDAGFETGIHSWDHVLWQDRVALADSEWTRQHLERAMERYVDIFGTMATIHGAAGWQTNTHALRLAAKMGFHHCSDVRGTQPFWPLVEGEVLACLQLPTTLPTLDELIGVVGTDPEQAAQHLLTLTRLPPATGHVFTLHAELEGQKLLPLLDYLLTGWREQGYRLGALGTLAAHLERQHIPAAEIITGTVPGRSGTLFVQAPGFHRDASPGIRIVP